MKTKHSLTIIALLALVSSVVMAAPLGTAFTYQGRLTDGINPADGHYDLRLILYNADIGGSQVGPILTNASVSVAGGLFTTSLDFGSGFFEGTAYWLDLAVRTNGGGAFIPLSPRQPLTPAPYALYSSIASNFTGVVLDAQISPNIARLNTNQTFTGTISFSPPTGAPFAVGNSNQVFNLNAHLLDGYDAAAFAPAKHTHDAAYWKRSGNTNTIAGTDFVGTTDNQPLELKVNNARALRLEPNDTNSVNLVGGAAGNAVGPGVVGATIAGGGTLNYSGGSLTNFVGTNLVAADFGAMGGGAGNTIEAEAAFSTLGGGQANAIQMAASHATIAGGNANTIQTTAAYSAVGGGFANTIQSAAQCATINGGRLNVIQASAPFATISGGTGNSIAANATAAAICGGGGNRVLASATYGAIAGGGDNTLAASAQYAAIPGGQLNTASGHYSLAAGRRAKALHDGSFVWADATDADFASTTTNQFAIRAGNGVVIQAATDTSTALELRTGGIRVPGAGLNTPGPVFIHRATGSNILGNGTWIDHPLCNGDPNAILIVTHNLNPGGGYAIQNEHPIAVAYYGETIRRWGIFNLGYQADMTLGAAFNVLVVKP